LWFFNNEVQFLTAAHAAQDRNQLQTEHSEKLRELLTERYDILKTFVETQIRLKEIGQSGEMQIGTATVAMLYAKADLCTTISERIKIHEKICDILRKQEEMQIQEFETGRVSPEGVMEARLARLDAQIKLEKERIAQNASRYMPNKPILKIITDARDVVIENISNAQSIAYKKNVVNFVDNSTLVIKRDFSQGKIIRTERLLDLAISGKGFFHVTDSKDRSFFTRYSSFLVRPNGMMVLETGEALEPIIFIPKDAEKIHIVKDGSVSCTTADGKESVVGAIALSRFPNEEGLEYKGKGLYVQTSRSGIPTRGAAGSEGFGHIESGYIESSNVDVTEQIRVLSELSRFEQSVIKAFSIVHQKPLWAEQTALALTREPKDNLPVIVRLKTKNEVVTILAGQTEPLYNVTTKDGKILAQYLSEKQLQKNLPGIYRLLKTSYTDNPNNAFIWAGSISQH
jgi:flagellar basal body rod protein FlgG